MGSSPLEIFINILIVLLILSVLIAIHEAGHLSIAKLFNVYCFEYSLGFGPKIFKCKRKKGETYFSLRALPLGGFVSMYGEKESVPEDFVPPPKERSLEGIAKWKKGLILIAGVTMNFALGLVLIFVSCYALPVYYSSYGVQIKNTTSYFLENEYKTKTEVNDYLTADLLSYNARAEQEGKKPATIQDYYLLMPALVDYGYIIDDAVAIFNVEDVRLNPEITYSAVYYPSVLVNNHALADAIRLYPARVINLENTDEKLIHDVYGFNFMPNEDSMKNGEYYKATGESDGVHFSLDLNFLNRRDHKEYKTDENDKAWNEVFDNRVIHGITFKYKNLVLEDNGINVLSISQKLNFKQSLKLWTQRVPTACSAIIKGFASLFTKDGLKNMSGIIGMTAGLPKLTALGGSSHIFFYAGIISINLAFFNLLPFPALDGWALLVTAVEGITKKRIPAKVQGIVSIIGFAILFMLMIAIMVKDVIVLV